MYRSAHIAINAIRLNEKNGQKRAKGRRQVSHLNHALVLLTIFAVPARSPRAFRTTSSGLSACSKAVRIRVPKSSWDEGRCMPERRFGSAGEGVGWVVVVRMSKKGECCRTLSVGFGEGKNSEEGSEMCRAAISTSSGAVSAVGSGTVGVSNRAARAAAIFCASFDNGLLGEAMSSPPVEVGVGGAAVRVGVEFPEAASLRF